MGIRICKGPAQDGGFILHDRIHITMRELRALSLIAMGLENEEVADELGVSVNTVRNHIYNIMKKLGAKHRAHAVALAMENGIMEAVRQNTLEWSPDEYVYCLLCGRTYRRDELVELPPEKIVINHVEYETPAELRCPYSLCAGFDKDTVAWKEIRKRHPEYPEIPEYGVRYDDEECFKFDKE
jgi:DNA-binding CsgD family transcriptional regulator